MLSINYLLINRQYKIISFFSPSSAACIATGLASALGFQSTSGTLTRLSFDPTFLSLALSTAPLWFPTYLLLLLGTLHHLLEFFIGDDQLLIYAQKLTILFLKRFIMLQITLLLRKVLSLKGRQFIVCQLHLLLQTVNVLYLMEVHCGLVSKTAFTGE